MRVDLHQHLLPAPLLDLLGRRRQPPWRDGDRLIPVYDAPFVLSESGHDAGLRAAAAYRDGLDAVVLSLSPALGIEYLPSAESEELLATWHQATAPLPSIFRHWVSCSVAEPDPDRVRADLAHPRAVGLQLPADALTPDGVARLADLLQVATDLDKPVLVHPGRAAAQGGNIPAWWAPVVEYVGQLHGAWHTWLHCGAPRHPQLRVVFVALAGLAPLHYERRAARGGEPSRNPFDHNIFYETSSYGVSAVTAVDAVVGTDVLVHGSDLPNAAPTTSYGAPARDRAIFETNPSRLLKGDRE